MQNERRDEEDIRGEPDSSFGLGNHFGRASSLSLFSCWVAESVFLWRQPASNGRSIAARPELETQLRKTQCKHIADSPARPSRHFSSFFSIFVIAIRLGQQ